MTNQSSSTRESILTALNRSKDLTVHDLALECGVGEPAIRFHLRKLKAAGLVAEFQSMDVGLKAGRKFHKFRRMLQEQTGNVESLCKTLLSVISDINPEFEPLLPGVIAESLLGEYRRSVKPGTASLLELIEWLNQHHYMAGWEAGKQGPVIRFQNCPYRSIRSGNEILCNIDALILQKMSGQVWEQKKHIQWENLAGECLFIVKPAA
jgi:predicted ArsR family transcriptional regulator